MDIQYITNTNWKLITVQKDRSTQMWRDFFFKEEKSANSDAKCANCFVSAIPFPNDVVCSISHYFGDLGKEIAETRKDPKLFQYATDPKASWHLWQWTPAQCSLAEANSIWCQYKEVLFVPVWRFFNCHPLIAIWKENSEFKPFIQFMLWN